MGLLSEGHPLSWEETKALADHVRKHGVQQFIHLYRKLETRKGDVLKWGDEVEYVLVKMDKKKKTCKLLLKDVKPTPLTPAWLKIFGGGDAYHVSLRYKYPTRHIKKKPQTAKFKI